MVNNSRTTNVIRWTVILSDFVVLNLLVVLFTKYHPIVSAWPWELKWVFLLCQNLSLLLSELRFSTLVHRRLVSAGDILPRVVWLVLVQTLISYVLLKGMSYHIPSGRVLLMFLPPFLGSLVLFRFVERWCVKRLRRRGRNSRTVTLVGHDPELLNIHERLTDDPTYGYRVLGYYADAEMGEWTHSLQSEARSGLGAESNGKRDREPGSRPTIRRLGTLQEFLQMMDTCPEELVCGNELYVSLSRRDRDIIRRISRFCDHRVVRFHYVPVSVESLGMELKRELVDDMEVYTTYEIPLNSPLNKLVKRVFDIIASLVFLLPTAMLLPFIWAIIRVQSPGPLFFRQKRTGIDGREFDMLKFRSMHVNRDADVVQATKDDPRKFPFGNFMRRSNIDELPQFLNVLRGDMSFVGPRPHMLLHTEQYSGLIDRYMVRHFVKPGLTGWAQVTGFRGETRELWQMEERVRRDIWYIEHWSIWLDIRIIWMTVKTIFVHDKNAY